MNYRKNNKGMCRGNDCDANIYNGNDICILHGKMQYGEAYGI